MTCLLCPILAKSSNLNESVSDEKANYNYLDLSRPFLKLFRDYFRKMKDLRKFFSVFIEHSIFSRIMGLYMHTDSVRFDLLTSIELR